MTKDFVNQGCDLHAAFNNKDQWDPLLIILSTVVSHTLCTQIKIIISCYSSGINKVKTITPCYLKFLVHFTTIIVSEIYTESW